MATGKHTFLPRRTLLDGVFMIDGLESIFPFIYAGMDFIV